MNFLSLCICIWYMYRKQFALHLQISTVTWHMTFYHFDIVDIFVQQLDLQHLRHHLFVSQNRKHSFH